METTVKPIRKRKNYKEFWQNVLKNSDKEVKAFNCDIDDMPKAVVLKIAKRITKSFPCYVYVWQSNEKPKNFHIHVELKEPMKLWQSIIARLLSFDDHKRIRMDLIRCGNNQPQLCDYISLRKYQYNLETKQLTLISSYRLIGEFQTNE